MIAYDNLLTIDDIAKITGLTTRTIRNYLKNGLLKGQKIGGQWRFTEKDLENLFDNNTAQENISEMNQKHLMEFINSKFSEQIEGYRICTVIDYFGSIESMKMLCDKLIDCVNLYESGGNNRFNYEYEEKIKKARFTVFGDIDFIQEILTITKDFQGR